jgi:UDP:flavonoid glycosyltransferase YjiC (YdhE family)
MYAPFMPNVLFVVAPEAGHILPTLSLTRRLVSRGIKVSYWTAPQFRGLVEGAGAGLEPMLDQDPVEQNFSGGHIWVQFAPTGRRLRARLIEKAIRSLLHRRHFDLVLFDRLFPTDYQCQIADLVDEQRTLLFSTSLPNWRELERKRLYSKMLIFCPVEFEVPKFRYPCAGLQYVEPSLRSPDEDTIRDPEVDPTKPLVLATFGTQSIRYRHLHDQFRVIVELATRQTTLQFLVAVGAAQRINGEDLRYIPSNLLVREKLPQRRLLEKAKVLISHGGLGSIKEAIVAGVPLVVLPASHDQPFNAMRVRYHGLGEAIFPEQLTLKALETSVLASVRGKYEYDLYAMQDKFVAMEAAKPSDAVIQTHLAGV